MINRTPVYELPMPEENDNYSLSIVNEVTQKTEDALAEVSKQLRNKANRDEVSKQLGEISAEFLQIGKQSLSINNDFRINQRGQASYTEVGNAKKYTVDGFYISKGTLTVTGGGVTFLASSQFGHFTQIVEIPEYLRGKSVSLVIDATGLAGKKIILDGTYSGTLVEGVNVFKKTLSNSATVLIQFVDTNSSEFSPTVIRRFALYSGNFNGFAPTDTATELVRCQRYQFMGVGLRGWPVSISLNDIDFYVPTPIRLRTTPMFVGDFQVLLNSGVRIDGFSVKAVYLYENVAQMKLTKTAHGLTFSPLGSLETLNNSGFDANL